LVKTLVWPKQLSGQNPYSATATNAQEQ